MNYGSPIAGCHLSNDSGIVIFEATDEYVVSGFSSGNNPVSDVRRRKVYCDREGNMYFNWRGTRIFLSECIRI